MTNWSHRSPKPLPIPLAMSNATTMNDPEPAGPQPTALPGQDAASPSRNSLAHRFRNTNDKNKDQDQNQGQDEELTTPDRIPYPTPKLRLEIRDLNHTGAQRFLSAVNASIALADAVRTVVRILYSPSPKKPLPPIPAIRSVTLILKSMPGVAYTTSMELDDMHKEIHVSLDYINGQGEDKFKHEVLGVLVHEMVHVWQWAAEGTPGGLVEGVADWVRLKAGYAPPHWRASPGEKWDEGYERTGYFLAWLEKEYGGGRVVRLNGLLRGERYREEIWEQVFGKGVKELFEEYKQHSKREERKE